MKKTPRKKRSEGSRAQQNGKLSKDEKMIHAVMCGNGKIVLVHDNKMVPDNQLYVLSFYAPTSITDEQLLRFLDAGGKLQQKYFEYSAAQR